MSTRRKDGGLDDSSRGCTRLTVAGDALVFETCGAEPLTRQHHPELAWSEVHRRFFGTELPSEAEVEHAINAVEDALMADSGLHQTRGLPLYTDDPVLARVLTPSGLWTLDDVEALFSRYARASMRGTTAGDTLALTPPDFAALLVLREILHHLGYVSITVGDPA